MKLKTQENIRRLEIIGMFTLDILKEQNINLDIDIDTLCLIISTLLNVDILTFGYTQRLTKEYKELKGMYNEVIKNTSSLLKELNVDDPNVLFAIYVYLYRGGYLSYNHSFEYSNDMKDFASLSGLDVIRGTGVCRSISSFFTNLCIEQDYIATNLTVNTTGKVCKNLQKMSPQILRKELSGKKLAEIVSTITKIIPLPNHLITLVKDNNMSYIFDPTNDGFLIYDAKNKITIPNNKDLAMTSKPIMQMIQRGNGTLKSLSIREINSILKTPSISDEAYREKYIEGLKLCKNNLLLFEELYNNNTKLYEDIYNLSNEQNDLIKRLIPIIPNIKKKVK